MIIIGGANRYDLMSHLINSSNSQVNRHPIAPELAVARGGSRQAAGQPTVQQAIVLSPMRLMIYAQDGLGLGHMRRTTSIAAELIKLRPDSMVLTVEDSPLGNFFRTSPISTGSRRASPGRSGIAATSALPPAHAIRSGSVLNTRKAFTPARS